MAKYISNRQQNLRIGISSYTENKQVLEVIGNANISGIATAFKFSGDGSELTNIVASFAQTATNVVGGIASVSTLSVSGDSTLGIIDGTSANFSGVVTATNFYGDLIGNSNSSTVANYATSSGISTYSDVSGISTYSLVAGISTYADTSGISTYSESSGLSTTAINIIGGIASVSSLSVSGVSTVGFITGTDAFFSGVVTANQFVGDASGLSNIGFASISGYSEISGIATNVIGGIASVTSLSVSGTSTLGMVEISSGIITATSGVVTYYGDGSNLTGVTGFNIVEEDAQTTPVYLTFIENVGVSTIGISTEKLSFIPSSGNLGIGTKTPTSRLTVDGDGLFTGIVTASSFSGTITTSTNVIGGIGSVSSLSVTGFSTFSNISVASSIFDSTNSSGNNQNVLTSTPTGILWQSASSLRGINIATSSVDSSFNIPFIDVGTGTTSNAFVAPSQLSYNPSRNFVGIGTTNTTSKLTIASSPQTSALGIGLDFSVSDSGSFVSSVSIGATVGAATTEKIRIRSISRDFGLMDVVNSSSNQLFSISTNDSDGLFRVNRYTRGSLISPAFLVGTSGFSTFYGEVSIANTTTVAIANSTGNSGIIGADIYGNVNIRSPFSTSTSYVAIAPNFRDNGALSFEAPVGAASTNRITQLFSITNNVSSSIFRVNDLNVNPILEVNVGGNIGIGTTNPQRKLEVSGVTRVTSTSSTQNEQIDIRHYRNISYQPTIGFAADNRGAISFDSPAGISTNGINFFPASLFAVTNDYNGNVLSVAGYTYFSGSRIPAIDVTQGSNVGIGTTSPSVKLDVVGNVNISGVSTVGLGSQSNPPSNSSMSFELTDNTTLTVRVRGTDGVVRTGIITLS